MARHRLLAGAVALALSAEALGVDRAGTVGLDGGAGERSGLSGDLEADSVGAAVAQREAAGALAHVQDAHGGASDELVERVAHGGARAAAGLALESGSAGGGARSQSSQLFVLDLLCNLVIVGGRSVAPLQHQKKYSTASDQSAKQHAACGDADDGAQS